MESSADALADPGLFEDEELDVVLEAWGWKESERPTSREAFSTT